MPSAFGIIDIVVADTLVNAETNAPYYAARIVVTNLAP